MPGAAKRRRGVQPGGHPLRAEVVAHHQRRRILAGAAAIFAERGYRAVSVADIVKSAAIARKRFYEQFSSKEDCFFALYELGTDEALREVQGACSASSGPFSERVGQGLAALLAYIEANPQIARSCIIEGPALGPAINVRLDAMIGRFAALLRAGRGDEGIPELPETVEETVVGGLYWMLYYALLEGRPKKIGRLLPQLTDFSLIPFGGAGALATPSPR